MTTPVYIESRLREINLLKRKITFNNIPAFYHSVATSLGMAEGMFKYGFENSLDTLLDKRNWNLDLLGGEDDGFGNIQCGTPPRISIYKLFTVHGFEIHCIPWLGQKEVDRDLNRHEQFEFKYWRAGSMKVVFRIAKLHTFIRMYFEHGDEADLQLIRFAHNLTEDFIEQLQPKFRTQKVYGVSVKNFFDFADKKLKAGEDVYLPSVYTLTD